MARERGHALRHPGAPFCRYVHELVGEKKFNAISEVNRQIINVYYSSTVKLALKAQPDGGVP